MVVSGGGLLPGVRLRWRAIYRDRWIECTSEEVRIRGYYFPWGTKRIPHSTIRGLERIRLGVGTGKGRIWGTADPRYWFNLGPGRPGKEGGLVLDVGRRVRPVITPDDPEQAEAAIRQGIGGGAGGGGIDSP